MLAQGRLGDHEGPAGVGFGGVEHVLDGLDVAAAVEVTGVELLMGASGLAGGVDDVWQVVGIDEDGSEQVRAGVLVQADERFVDERNRVCGHGRIPFRR